MSSLAHLFAEIAEGLSRPAEHPVSGISGFRQGQPEQQVNDKYNVSGISGVSGDGKRPPQPLPVESAQARASARAGARARVPHAKPPEMPEPPEKPAGPTTCLSGSLSLKPGKPEKREGQTLRADLPFLSDDQAAAFFERAGFLEYDCGLSRFEAERQALAEIDAETKGPPLPPMPDHDGLALWRSGLARLHADRVPCGGYRGAEWPRTLERAHAFLDAFGQQAEALGWTAPRLFAAHPAAGIVRVDACGALVLPGAGPVLAITDTEVRFARSTHRQHPGQPEGVPLWQFLP